MHRTKNTFSFRELEEISPLDFQGLLDEIGDDQAVDSDCGGDSDADNVLPNTHPANTSWGDNSFHDSCSDILPSPQQTCVIPESDEDEDESEEGDEHDDVHVRLTVHYNFSKNCTYPAIYNSVNYSQGFGTNVELNLESPVAIFSLFFPNFILEHILKESNRYANQKGTDLNLTTVELKAFLVQFL